MYGKISKSQGIRIIGSFFFYGTDFKVYNLFRGVTTPYSVLF
jgi:hypothetical protein